MSMDRSVTNRQISVIIPVYNCRTYLEGAVASVLRQPSKMIDIVMVDDGSTDGSAELCDQLAAKYGRIHVIHQKNGGVSSARNAGIEYVLSAPVVETRYICFLDADDCWEQMFFSDRIADLLEGGYHLLGFQSLDCDQNLNRTSSPRAMEQGCRRGGAEQVWVHSQQHFGAMFYAAKLLRDYGIRFQDGLRYSEDKIFSMQCLYLADTIWLENHVLYLYRHTRNSAIGSRKYGISYYIPIVEGYLQMDACMRKYVTESRGRLLACKICVTHYLMDMIDEHFRQWGTKAEVDQLLNEHPQYLAALKAEADFAVIPQEARYLCYASHPYKYMLQHYVLGMGFYIRRFLKRFVG